MLEILKDPKVIAAIIAAITSIITIFILKPFIEKRLFKFKLVEEHKYEQRKLIKEVLAKNKVNLLNSAEQLNHRFWNFRNNYSKNWHLVKGDYFNKENYYFNSFIYRILAFFAWIKITNKEMIFIDTTIATKDDLFFIKYLQIFPQIMCDLFLFEGFEYDSNSSSDHFFRNDFENIITTLIENEVVIDYAKYLNKLDNEMGNLKEQYSRLCNFLDGLSPNEKRLRFDRLQLLHLTIITFLNKYGYDFQYTDKEKIIKIIQKPRISKLVNNYEKLIIRGKLNKEKEMKKLLKVIKNFA